MQSSVFAFKITSASLEYFKQRSFGIIFDVFNSMNSCENELVKDYVCNIGNEEFYESLKYHNDLIYSSILTKNQDLLKDFFIWKYSVYRSRNIDVDCFLQEYGFWKESVLNHLYPSHANEINIIYDYLISNHENFKINASKRKNIFVNSEYQDLFGELLFCLLNSGKNEFYSLVRRNLNKFDNDIFLFTKELIKPLMYKIGQMWQLNEISVAKEHFATSLIDEIINDLIKENFFEDSHNPLVLTSTVGNELHNLGIKIVGKFIESHGFCVKNLSSKISNKELINSIYVLKPKLVVLSVTLPSNVATLQEIVKELKSDLNLFSGKIVIGGQGLFSTEKIVSIDDADFCSRNLEELESFLKNLR